MINGRETHLGWVFIRFHSPTLPIQGSMIFTNDDRSWTTQVFFFFFFYLTCVVSEALHDGSDVDRLVYVCEDNGSPHPPAKSMYSAVMGQGAYAVEVIHSGDDERDRWYQGLDKLG